MGAISLVYGINGHARASALWALSGAILAGVTFSIDALVRELAAVEQGVPT